MDSQDITLIERLSKKISLNGKEFLIEEPSRKKLMEYLDLLKQCSRDVLKQSKPIQVLQENLKIAFESNNQADIEKFTQELDDEAMKLSQSSIVYDDKIIKFILGADASDEFIDNMGIVQKKKIMEIAEEVYNIGEVLKNGQMLPMGGMM